MAQYIVEGGVGLNGKIRISGNKNATFPCIGAALLTRDEVVINNIPKIVDVEVLIQILNELGVSVNFSGHTLRIKAEEIVTEKLPEDLTTRLRGSIVLAGALLARKQKVEFYHPGGDVIGKRGIDVHLDGFSKLGYLLKVEDRKYKVKGTKNTGETKIFMQFPSVTGTENLVLASVLGKGSVILKNCATEPHIVDLCLMLKSMGAQIDGIGSPTLKIEGVAELSGTEYTIGSDYIEFGTYAVAAAITGGKVMLENCYGLDVDPIIWPLEKMGVNIRSRSGEYEISVGKMYGIEHLRTNIWPGFPTDLMSVMIVLATQVNGASLFHDWIYESRMFFVDKLISMGANIVIADPHRVLVYGPGALKARNLETPDIRAGMAMVLAALAAEGTSTINRAELIERGYADVVENLKSLGAKIERIDS